ncbi:MAG: hypothetical protein LQ351_005680 [Letrouitia transgressa]|nr:MAG: hypothetical protein LQ351_005680 [Letrouitia transgressa]
MEQNRVADLESIVGEITSFGRTNLIHKPSNAQHNKGTEDTELVNAGQDGQYHLSNNTPQDEDQGIQTLIVDTNQSKASPTFASKDSIPSYQQRINFISRPESTRNDLSPGFAFGKAQLLKPLKFDRKLGQSLPERIFRKKSTDVLKDCCKVTTEGSHVSDNLEGPSLQPNDHDISSGLAQSKVLAEGNMETAYGDHSDGITTSQLISQDSLASHDSSHRGLPTPCGQALSNVSENARTTLLETAIVSHEGQESFVIGETTPPAELFPHQSLDTFINRLDDKGFLTDDKRATAAAAPPRKVTETVCQSPNSLQATPLDATEAETRSKSVQSPGPVASEPFLPPDSNRMFTDEKLIDVFVSRYRDQYQANVQAKAQEAQQAAEIQDLTGVCYEMHDRLARAQMEVVAKEKELLKYHEQVPKWQLRISKLSDYIRRLNSDHHNLRNGFRIIENQQKDLLAEKITLERSLKEIRYTIKVEHSKSRNQLSKARQDVRRLQETLTLQDVQLGQEISSLQVERDNSKRLQNELVRMNTSHKTVVKTLSHEGALLKTKMDDLLVCIDGTSNHKMSSGQAATREDVRDCFELLREVRKAETAREQDFQNLCTYMRGRFDQ